MTNMCAGGRCGHRVFATAACIGFLLASIYSWSQTSNKPLAVITHADQIRRLSPEEAARGYPVRIRGVITMDAPAPDFFIQDSTAGIFVEGSVSTKFPHMIKQFVEVEGVTGPGKFAPVVREKKLRVLRTGLLPKAQLFPFSQLANGQQDSQWVQVRGIVRSVAIDRSSWPETTLAIRVASEGGQFSARVPIDHEQNFSSWVDTEVLVEGVCGSLYNANRQLTGILLYVPRLSFIKIEAPAAEVPVSALLRFSPGKWSRHRVKIRGVVAYQQMGNAIFLQVQGKGLHVLTQQPTPLEIGDVVDVLGFPAMGDSAPILEDAVFHRLGHQPPPQPTKLDLSSPWEQFDSSVVTTDATLLDHQLQPDGLRLLLQSGSVLFDATLPRGPSASPLVSIPLNSRLRVSGIGAVRSGGLWQVPESFRILLRSPDDVVVLSTPPWWNLRHTLWLLGLTVGILLVVVVWVVVLGRRVRSQMQVIRQRLRHGAVLEERNRIARELHDTLEQELAGITMQLDLASDCFQKAPNIAHQALESARDMSRHSMIEARRSVWDLRCQLLEDGDLVSAITRIVQPPAARESAKIEVRIQGEPLRLPGQIEMNLLRIAQEAVANALQHGRARQITIELQYSQKFICLTVTDDGSGFTPSQSPRSGHFGLLDMRERAQSMGSELKIDSKPGGGSSVIVKVALDSSEVNDAPLKANTYSGR
ncbi:MAG TPA: sensor histidine kinase [Terriglobales bacterium]|nr:sensor histidine kinase [Terriglobales bacterium]